MKIQLVDIVNLNADASCLSSEHWLHLLKGEKESHIYQFFKQYVIQEKKVSLGITGATLVDIFTFNPSSIELLNAHPGIFEIILRPFSHDIGLMRTEEGFKYNLQKGKEVIQSLFDQITLYFLPPEFMLTNDQISFFDDFEIEGTFTCAGRYDKDMQARIPSLPYKVKGVFGSKTTCIPLDYKLTRAYLEGIHYYNAKKWSNTILGANASLQFSWRDGESTFFIPDGNAREAAWLNAENKAIERIFLRNAALEIFPSNQLPKEVYHHYPIHSFNAWLKEMRMIGFLQSIKDYESKLEQLSDEEKAIWLQLINSDILSAVEKKSPIIDILDEKNGSIEKFTIWRSERHIEGKECVFLLNRKPKERQLIIDKNKQLPFIQKLTARINYLLQANEKN